MRTERRRRSLRLPDFDYRTPGAYFVTICTWQGSMLLTGETVRSLVEAIWRDIPRHFPDARADAFVVMPNHVHGVLFIMDVGARHASPLRGGQQAGVAAGSLGAIIGSFKSEVARRVNQVRGTPGAPIWQRNYYERVIRGEEELNLVRRYIEENPTRWDEDVNNPHRIGRTSLPRKGASYLDWEVLG